MTPSGAVREPTGAGEALAGRLTDAWVLPPGIPAPDAYDRLRAGELPVRHPTRDALDADTVISALRDAHRGLAAIPTAGMVRILGGAAEALTRELDRADLRDIAANGRLSAAMARAVVEGMAPSWTTAALDHLVRAEFPDPRMLGGFVAETGGREGAADEAAPGVRDDAGEPGQPARAAAAAAPRRYVRAAAPAVTLHFGAGSVPGVTVTSMIRALLVRSAVLVKPGAGDIALTVRFARLLHRADPRLARAVAVQYWPGGAPEWDGWERDLVRAADQVVVYGGDGAIESVRARAPASTRVIEHPHRIGVAIVDARAPGPDDADAPPGDATVPGSDLLARAAQATARAAALFEQRGCVSTHLVLLVGGEAAASAFCAELADGLAALETELPPGPRTPAEMSSLHQIRGRLAMKGAALGTAATGSWTVILASAEAFEPIDGRSVWVVPVDGLEPCRELLAPLSPVLQTIGLAGFDGSRAAALAEDLVAIGATRIVPLDQVPFPAADWLHDGARPLRELVRWSELR